MASPLSGECLKKISAKIDWKIIVLAIFFLLAIFLRVWHFHDWLFFKMDQARDATLSKQALETGPGLAAASRAEGRRNASQSRAGFLLFSISFGRCFFTVSHPAVLAYPDLFFSILSIPLFYLLPQKIFFPRLVNDSCGSLRCVLSGN